PSSVDEMCLVARIQDFPDDTAVNLAETTIPLVGYPESYALRRMLRSAGLNNRVVAEAETINAMLRLCSMGIGACILPMRIPTTLLTDYGLKKVDLAPPGLQRRVVTIVRKDAAPNSLARQLLMLASSPG